MTDETSNQINPAPHCWCGNTQLTRFSDEYWQCPACQTLIWVGKENAGIISTDEAVEDYYTSRYWFEHQVVDLGLPDIISRARNDLPERCLYWLQTTLKHRLPPGKTLELGSSHGGFVAILTAAGFDAAGLEISPEIAEFSRQTFNIPVLVGKIETQQLPPASLDLIVLMDVLEHLDDPVKTLKHCLNLLKDDGLFVIQTPGYPAGKTLRELEDERSLFIRMLIPHEHIHLFSKQAVIKIFSELSVPNILFEPAYFAVHDIFFFASRLPIPEISQDTILTYLLAEPSRRLILAMLDLTREIEQQKHSLEEIKVDCQAQSAHNTTLEKRLAQQQGLLDQMPPGSLQRPIQFVRRVKWKFCKYLKRNG